MVLRCRNCRYQDHKHCTGTPDGPPGHQCRCRQCWTREIMDLASKALEGNSLPKIRAALEAVYALQFQTMVQRQRLAKRQPGIARCESCGKPVSVKRRPRLREPVYCRRNSTCRWHA